MLTSTAAKHRTSRATHYAAARQEWRESKPHLALDDAAISIDELPSPCPVGRKMLDDGLMEYRGVTIVIPSPGISKAVNGRAAQFWRSQGFELREAHNHPDLVENYVKEWVRLCDKPLRGKLFSAKAWLECATRKYKEFYL